MKPNEYDMVKTAIEIFQEHDMNVVNTKSSWLVYHPDGEQFGRFVDSSEIFHAAIGLRAGYKKALDDAGVVLNGRI